MSLQAKQTLFLFLLADLILYAKSKGYELTLGEGFISNPRAVAVQNGARVQAEDRVHMVGSLHYLKLAQDVNLFINGEWIKDGGHVAWTDLGVKWESMNPACAWGGRFHDANHFSLHHEGRA